MTPLSDLDPGQRARVVTLGPACGDRRRLTELGVRPGAHVQLVRRAPLRGAIALRVGAGVLAVRTDSASQVLVEREDAR